MVVVVTVVALPLAVVPFADVAGAVGTSTRATSARATSAGATPSCGAGRGLLLERGAARREISGVPTGDGSVLIPDEDGSLAGGLGLIRRGRSGLADADARARGAVVIGQGHDDERGGGDQADDADEYGGLHRFHSTHCVNGV